MEKTVVIKILIIVICVFSYELHAQELFPSTEPASTLPKKLFSLRISGNHYKEPLGRPKYWTGIRAMYGATRNLTLIGTLSASNHHLKAFPGNILDYFRFHHTRNFPAFPYLIEGFHLYAKYRIFSHDEKQKHLRIAFYGEVSKVLGVHDTAEPNLLGDNSGFGTGLILTKLHNKLAFSFTGGYIYPLTYKDSIVTFKSGDGWIYNFSAGYRIFPKIYSDYNNININLYVEVLGKSYDEAKFTVRNTTFPLERFLPEDVYTYNSLIKGSFWEIRPALQFIFDSKTRLDLGVAFPVMNRSYLNYYPLVFFNFQKYFFRH